MFLLEFRAEVNRQESRIMGLSSSEDGLTENGGPEKGGPTSESNDRKFFFKYSLLSQERVKLRTSNFVRTFTGSIGTKAH